QFDGKKKHKRDASKRSIRRILLSRWIDHAEMGSRAFGKTIDTLQSNQWTITTEFQSKRVVYRHRSSDPT
ncbi:unnamed protein product, partial [Ceratitis capitata]